MRLRIIQNTPKFKHIVFSLQSGELENDLKRLSINVFILPKFLPRIFGFLFYLILLLKTKPNIVHAMPWVPNLFARIAKLMPGFKNYKIICDYHGFAYLGRIQILIDKITINLSDKIFFVSNEVKDWLENKWDKKILQNKSFIFKNFVSHREFEFSKKNRVFFRSKLELDKFDFALGIVARLDKIKRIDFLIKFCAPIIKKFPNFKLLICGEGPLKIELHNLVKKEKVEKNILFMEFEHKELSKIYSAFDAFALCSESEGLPTVLLEAAANGCPVFLSKNLYRFNHIFTKKQHALSELQCATSHVLRDKNHKSFLRPEFEQDVFIEKISHQYLELK